MEVVVERITMTAADGVPLRATWYRSPETHPSYAVVVFTGIGIPARFYDALARALALGGHPSLTFDYRAVGESRSARSLRGDGSTFIDWASKDCAVAVATVQTAYPTAPIVGIAHSFGAFLAGCSAQADRLSALVMLGPHTGRPHDYARRWRYPMWLGWHVLMPASAKLLGYFPGRWLGLPADLPEAIARDWAARRGPDVWTELMDRYPAGRREEIESLRARMQSLAMPILAIRATDDAFSTESGAAGLLRHYPNAPAEAVTWDAAEMGLDRIGHMRYLSRQVQGAWRGVDAWLTAVLAAAAPLNAGGGSDPESPP